jgi:hypothetical protein
MAILSVAGEYNPEFVVPNSSCGVDAVPPDGTDTGIDALIRVLLKDNLSTPDTVNPRLPDVFRYIPVVLSATKDILGDPDIPEACNTFPLVTVFPLFQYCTSAPSNDSVMLDGDVLVKLNPLVGLCIKLIAGVSTDPFEHTS